jgi:hypothetical protein
MRLATIVVVIWLLIGLAAAVQRGYFSSDKTNCGEIGDTVLTVAAGPLNYIGVNPKIKCRDLPEPSR